MGTVERAEVIVMVGMQASGKTTHYADHLSSTHVHVSRDLIPGGDRGRQAKLIREFLGRGVSVCVDNTHPSRVRRAEVIAIADEFGARKVCLLFEPDLDASKRRNALRTDKDPIPMVGLYQFLRTYEEPTLDEGFDEIRRVL